MTLWDPRGAFVPMVTDSKRKTVAVNRKEWLRKCADGSLVILFNECHSPLLTECNRALFHGIPIVIEKGPVRASVHSNGDHRFQFEVTKHFYSSRREGEIRFRPIGFSAVGSFPVRICEKSDDSCPICLEEYTIGEYVAETKFRHRFHLHCLRQLRKRRCPYCRGSLDLV
jgi:hypothetical protein